MSVKKSSTINLRSGSKTTDAVGIDGKGPLSIQAFTTDLAGTPTYTVEVSGSKVPNSFKKYDPLSTDVDVTDSIEITHTIIPWKYVRFVVTSTTGDTGTIVFNVNINE